MVLGLEGLENLEEKDEKEIKFLLQQINDKLDGGLTSSNIVSFRNTYIINTQDSLDADYPMYVHFNIIDEMIKIVSVKVDFWVLNYRAYSTAAKSGGAVSSASGGGETPTSSSGGEVTSASGGGETPTSSSDGDAVPTSSSGGDSTPTSSSQGAASGGGSTSGATGSASGGAETSGASSSGLTTTYVTSVGDQSSDGHLITSSTTHTHTMPNHTHPNHTHTTPAHTHPGHTHTVTIAAHTHTVTIAAHTHTVTVAAHTHTGGAHTHTVTIAAHTHTGGAHTHGITYGIFEEDTSPKIKFYISENEGVSYSDVFGGYTIDKSGLDITSLLTSSGSKLIKFTSDIRARLAVQIMIKLDISAR